LDGRAHATARRAPRVTTVQDGGRRERDLGRVPRPSLRALAAALCAVAATSVGAHRAAAQSSSFVTTLGRDTLSIEQFRRAGDTITGDWVTRYGGIMYHHYTIVLRPDGRVRHYLLSLHRASGKPEGAIELTFDDDSLTVRSDSGNPRRLAVGADAPIFANTVALLETITTRARSAARDSAVVPVVRAFGPYQRVGLPVRFGPGAARLGDPRAPLEVWTDRDGRVTRISARATTTRTETARVPAFDLAAVVRRFPDVPDETPIVGVAALSPRDTARAVVGRAAITVDYGRPSVRGRDVFSHGVLGDTLWRVGANAATQFTTTADLAIGGRTLSAGTYSLWIRVPPDDASYALVFNTQSGQWGTEHHAERDVLSVPLSVRRAPAFAERLAIAIDASGDAAVLRVRWADLELSTPLAPAPRQ
jgi:hypothetical protein